MSISPTSAAHSTAPDDLVGLTTSRRRSRALSRSRIDMERGDLEGIVLKDRESTYRGGSRAGWFKVKDPSWYEREAWRFGRR